VNHSLVGWLSLLALMESTMTYPSNPLNRSPKGDHNRRLSLGLAPDAFSRLANITTEELHRYEMTPPDGDFDPEVAEKVGSALEVMEAVKQPLVSNGPKPDEKTQTDGETEEFDDVSVDAEREEEDTTSHPNPSPMNPAFP
jgi:hypothetical protein